MNWHIDQSAKGDPGDASASELLDALADHRRREVLRTVADEGRVPVDHLVAAVASGGSVGDERDRQDVHVRLRHADLPKLAEADLLAVDRDADRVAVRQWPPLVEAVLRAVDDGLGD